jgi:hypothetical protein
MKDKKIMLAIIATVVVIAAATAIITVANSRQDPPQQPEETSTDPGTQQPVEEPREPEKPTFVDGVICPLGGEMIERGDLYPRPVAVMLDNHPAARPQAGLEQAEVVYEILAEGNITRYLALYMHGADQMVNNS